jgi:hypothetical protein
VSSKYMTKHKHKPSPYPKNQNSSGFFLLSFLFWCGF